MSLFIRPAPPRGPRRLFSTGGVGRQNLSMAVSGSPPRGDGGRTALDSAGQQGGQGHNSDDNDNNARLSAKPSPAKPHYTAQPSPVQPSPPCQSASWHELACTAVAALGRPRPPHTAPWRRQRADRVVAASTVTGARTGQDAGRGRRGRTGLAVRVTSRGDAMWCDAGGFRQSGTA